MLSADAASRARLAPIRAPSASEGVSFGIRGDCLRRHDRSLAISARIRYTAARRLLATTTAPANTNIDAIAIMPQVQTAGMVTTGSATPKSQPGRGLFLWLLVKEQGQPPVEEFVIHPKIWLFS